MRIDHDTGRSAPSGNSGNTKAERCFDLSLAVTVNGSNAEGQDFEEITDLSSISSQEAVFWLKNKVIIGSKLVLSLNIPKTLILENQLNLIVSGEVVFATTDPSSRNQQLVSIQLDRLYKIQPIYSAR
jgi:hypothetical protein